MPHLSTAERVGLEKGRQEGARESLLAGIEVALDLKFAAPGLALMPEIRQIEDVELLRNILAAVKQTRDPEALRQIWSTR